jgi:predicted DsbA family dithiol-disulfide isomerase
MECLSLPNGIRAGHESEAPAGPAAQPKSVRIDRVARDKGRETHRALFKAFFEEGKDISDLGVLGEIAELVGLDAEEAKTAIELGTHRKRVIDQERRATALGIRAAPTILLSSPGMPFENTAMLSGSTAIRSCAIGSAPSY